MVNNPLQTQIHKFYAFYLTTQRTFSIPFLYWHEHNPKSFTGEKPANTFRYVINIDAWFTQIAVLVVKWMRRLFSTQTLESLDKLPDKFLWFCYKF